MQRRTFLKLLGAATGLGVGHFSPLRQALAEEANAGHFFVCIHASGGWDVTLWADPRNEKLGLVSPSSGASTPASFAAGSTRRSTAIHAPSRW